MEESGVVHLNVGGTPFDTTLDTLTKYPDSMLGTMFSKGNRDLLKIEKDGRVSVIRDPEALKVEKDGRIFLDRDPVCFGVLLEFLRCGELHVHPHVCCPSKLRTELDYWGFDADDLRKKVRCENVGRELAEKARKELEKICEDVLDDAFHRLDTDYLTANGYTEFRLYMDPIPGSKQMLWLRRSVDEKIAKSELSDLEPGDQGLWSRLIRCIPDRNAHLPVLLESLSAHQANIDIDSYEMLLLSECISKCVGGGTNRRRLCERWMKKGISEYFIDDITSMKQKPREIHERHLSNILLRTLASIETTKSENPKDWLVY